AEQARHFPLEVADLGGGCARVTVVGSSFTWSERGRLREVGLLGGQLLLHLGRVGDDRRRRHEVTGVVLVRQHGLDEGSFDVRRRLLTNRNGHERWLWFRRRLILGHRKGGEAHFVV